jgi:polysaccharide pyruvyl transferase WcaK-like protein
MRIALIAPALAVPDAFHSRADHLFARSGGNTGNFAFVFALHHLLSPDVDVVPWEADPDAVRERYDLIVFACANQLGPHTDLGWLADRLTRMDRPILAIGLGAQSASTSGDVELTAGTRRWLEVIAAHAPSLAPNVGVRGNYTLAQLDRLGFGARSVVVGCPSNFINPDPALGQTIAKRHLGKIGRVAVPAGLQLWPGLQKIEENLADIVEACSGIYIAQSEIDMIRLARDEADAIAPDVLERLRAYIRPKLSMADFIQWARRYAVAFIDAASWTDAMRKFDFVVGPRFHGVMMAIQAGVPGGVIAHDSRTLELCETISIPVRDYRDVTETFEINDLPSMFPFDGAAYDRRRTHLARALAVMLSHAGITPRGLNLGAATAQAVAA